LGIKRCGMTYAMKGEIEQSSVRKESDLALFARPL